MSVWSTAAAVAWVADSVTPEVTARPVEPSPITKVSSPLERTRRKLTVTVPDSGNVTDAVASR